MTVDRLATALADRYRIERELGAGGMATVYLAQDLKHDRKVAIKVLRPELAAVIGADRFLSEIKTTANLQHPHILPLHDSGESDGFLFYVMPYVEGESLRDRLNREKQLPIADAVRISVEVAGALDYAHRHNVIHRDIKPENILLHDGRALVADFGIALAASKAGSTRMTETGMSLGTPHYMSPEQAMGEREITARSDVYALGCVTYELLCGEPPFGGPTAQAIVAKVLTEEPRPLLPKRHTIPPNVESAVLTALEKLPADRFATAAEYAAALNDPTGTAHGPRGTLISRAHPRPRREMMRFRGALAACVLLGAAAAWGWFRPRPVPPEMQFGLAFPKGQDPTNALALSRDGTLLIYNGPGDSAGGRLWMKEQGRYESTPLPGTEGAGLATFSPDGRWIAFTLNGKLVKMPRGGGAPTILADSATDAGIAWLDDGTLVYTSSLGRLKRVAASGGTAAALPRTDTTVIFRALPAPLPGARGVLYSGCRGLGCTPSDLWVADLAAGRSRMLVPDALRGWYLSTGVLLYATRDGRLFAVSIDLKRLELRGTAVPVLSDVAILFGVLPNFAVSEEGTVVMQTGGSTGGLLGNFDLVWVDRTGALRALDSTWQFHPSLLGGNFGLALSPDGSQVAIGLNTNSGDDIWLKRLPSGALSRLTFDTTSEERPRWTADGRSVSYIIGGTSVWRRRSDGTGAPELVRTPPQVAEAIWSRDGHWVIFRTGGQSVGTGFRNIYGMRVGDTTAIPLAADPRFDEEAPALSPDGRWLAYESNESGRTEVYVRPFPDVAGGKWQISTNGGQSPLWAHSGRELYFVDPGRNMIAAAVKPGPAFILGDRTTLFRLPTEVFLDASAHYAPFDIAPDDRHFLMFRQRMLVAQGEKEFLRIENWLPALQQQLREAK